MGTATRNSGDMGASQEQRRSTEGGGGGGGGGGRGLGGEGRKF